MTLQDLGNIGEFVAAIATLITLIYLAAQIRQNTRAVRSASLDSVATSNKALQLTWHSMLQSAFGSLLASTLGASATVGGLCRAAERPVRWEAAATWNPRFRQMSS